LSVRLYADECVNARILAGLRRRQIDLATVGEERLLGASDGEAFRVIAKTAKTLEDELLAARHQASCSPVP
jgi:hypothetical protein